MSKVSILQKFLLILAAVATSMGAFSIWGVSSTSFAGEHVFANVNDSIENITWFRNYERALDEARKTGKPIFLESRCAPWRAGRVFDAQVVQTDKNSPRGKLLSQYVTVRITSMTGVDIGLFDYDRHNALYYFVMNADEHIYMRYGGRDATSPTAYLDLSSIEAALTLGLQQHKLYNAGKIQKQEQPEPLFPRNIPLW
jgi:hypothetical protein